VRVAGTRIVADTFDPTIAQKYALGRPPKLTFGVDHTDFLLFTTATGRAGPPLRLARYTVTFADFLLVVPARLTFLFFPLPFTLPALIVTAAFLFFELGVTEADAADDADAPPAFAATTVNV